MVRFNLDIKLPEVIKLKNTNRFLIEGWIFGSSRIRKLSVSLGNKCFKAEHIEIYRPDVANNYFHEDPNLFSLFSGFTIPVIIEPVSKCEELEVILKAEFRNGEKFIHKIGVIKLKPWHSQSREFILPPGVTPDELLVICMATYNPKEIQFRRQVDSIIKQDYRNWICIVCDDGSDECCKDYMREILAKDPRFFFIENAENVGFYQNFERCLELVPSTAKYIALSDQDDYWYPNKLSESLNKLGGTTQLVYCDMRIVHENGDVISETYWKNRKNYYKEKDVDLLAIANTVTGAASVFRASLLEHILPFPPRYGNVFHDHWIALVAALNGGIDYIDKPLYDYIQNGQNVIGHTDFGLTSFATLIMHSDIWRSFLISNQNSTFVKRVLSFIRHTFLGAKNIYLFKHIAGKHIFTIIETASVRKCNDKLISLARRPLSFWGLLKMRAKIVRQKETTNNIELFLLFSKLLNFIYPAGVTILRHIMLYRLRKQNPLRKKMLLQT